MLERPVDIWRYDLLCIPLFCSQKEDPMIMQSFISWKRDIMFLRLPHVQRRPYVFNGYLLYMKMYNFS